MATNVVVNSPAVVVVKIMTCYTGKKDVILCLIYIKENTTNMLVSLG